MIDWETTNRGFVRGGFIDRYGAKCSIQKSSLAEEDAIWLGIDDPDPQVMVPGKGWQKIKLPEGALNCGRMHLTQDQVRALLPTLQKFAETGELERTSAVETIGTLDRGEST